MPNDSPPTERTATLLTRLLSLVGEEIPVPEDRGGSVVTVQSDTTRGEVARVAAELGSAFSEMADELRRTRQGLEEMTSGLAHRVERLEAGTSAGQQDDGRLRAMEDELEASRREGEALRIELGDVKAQLEGTIEQLEESRGELEAVRGKVVDLERSDEEARQRAEDAGAHTTAVEQKLAAAEGSRADLEARLDSQQTERDRDQEALAALTRDRDETARQLAAAVAERDQLAGKIGTASAERGDLAERLEIASKERGELAGEVSSLGKELERSAEKLAATEGEWTAAMEEVEDLGQERAELQRELEEVRASLSLLESVRSSGEGSLAASEIAQRISGLEQDLTRSREREDALSGECDRIRSERDEARADAGRLSEHVEKNRTLAEELDAARGGAARLQKELEDSRDEIAELRDARDAAMDRVGALYNEIARIEEEFQETTESEEVIPLTQPAERPAAPDPPVRPMQPPKPPWTQDKGADQPPEQPPLSVRSGAVLTARKDPPKKGGLSRLFGRDRKR